eukprot:gene4233-6010_t
MPPPLSELRNCLIDISQPIAKRTHAAFILRTMKSKEVVPVIAEALINKKDTPLMRHELAYILGQIQHEEACDVLCEILRDETDNVLVRHESAEALGAIGLLSSVSILKEFSTHEAPEISETCQIALDLINWKQQGENVNRSNYLSVDPAPPISDNISVDSLQRNLMDSSLSLFHRYRAMFSLRNLETDEAALALVTGFFDSSALFRHEIAYVLGQMQRAVTVDGLAHVLSNLNEHPMVRHEAAEALGAIGGTEAEEILSKFKEDSENVVVESCLVALDAIDYWSNYGSSTVTIS